MTYPLLPGEFGVRDATQPYGSAARFGILPGTGIDYENTGQMFAHRACSNLPGVNAWFPPGRYCGHNTGIWEAGTTVSADACERTGIVHFIAGGTAATATGTMSGGQIATTLVTNAGGPYFHPPLVRYRSTLSSTISNGGQLSANMKATTVFVIDSCPCWEVSDIVPVQNGIELQVTGIYGAGAKGKIKTAIVHTAGSMLDPTQNTYANRYYCGESPDTASAWFFVGFGVDSLNIDYPGSGGPDSVSFTALSWSAGVVTATTAPAHGLGVGSPFTSVGCTPAGYNGAFTPISGTTGTTLKWNLASDPGTATINGKIANIQIQIDLPTVLGLAEHGNQIIYGRLGIQGAVNFTLGSFLAKSDPAISIDGNPQPGAHIDYLSSGSIESYICENTGQTGGADKNGWSAFSVDGVGFVQSQRIRIGYMEVQRAAFHAVSIAADCRVDKMVILGFGEAATRTAIQYFGEATQQACGLLVYRGTPDVGTLEIAQNEARMGATAKYHLNVMSTGMQNANMANTPVLDAQNRYCQTENVSSRPMTIGNLILRNVCRGGVTIVDPSYPDVSNQALVEVAGLVSVQYSSVELMTSGWASKTHLGVSCSLDKPGIAVNAHSTGLAVAFNAADYRFLNSNGAGYLDGAAFLHAPNHFYAGAGVTTTWRSMTDQLHSNGIVALLENNAAGPILARSDSDRGMPFYRSLPLVWNRGQANISLDANCNALHQQGPVLWADSVSDAEISVQSRNYRNAPLVVLSAPTRVAVSRCLVVGVGGSEVGLQLVGAQAAVGYTNVDISACSVGAGVSGASFDSACYAVGANCHGNTTNTQIPSTALAGIACSTFAPP